MLKAIRILGVQAAFMVSVAEPLAAQASDSLSFIAARPSAQAQAVLFDANGQEVGTATLIEETDGLRIAIAVDGLKPGRLGFHVHERGRCEGPDFESAGDHFAPQGKEHGAENPDGPHAGDLPNLRVGSDGRAENETINPWLTLEGGDDSLMRPGGTSLIVHEQTDDYYTDPSGNTGARVACGVIRQ